jgi:phosphoserine phosphatase
MTNPRVPLVVDLDGTLIRTDAFWEIFFKGFLHNPLLILPSTVAFLRGGRPAVKKYLADTISINLETLPVNQHVLELIQKAKLEGTTVYLASGSDQKIVDQILRLRPEFTEGFGSDGKTNLTGVHKLNLLKEKFGQFDYIGNSWPDLPIFKGSRQAYLVSHNPTLIRTTRQQVPTIHLIPSVSLGLKGLLKARYFF